MFGIGVSPGTGNEVRSVLRVTERVSIPKSPTLRIIHDGVRFCCSIHMHSSYIELCKSAPRPSCIDMRDWWHEDRGMHIFVKYIAMPLSCSLLQQNRESATFRSLARISRNIAKQRLIGASQWISAQGSPTYIIHQSRGSPLACMPVYSFLSLIC